VPGIYDFFSFAVRRLLFTVILGAAILNLVFFSPCRAMQATHGPVTVQNNLSPNTGQILSSAPPAQSSASQTSPQSPASTPYSRGPALPSSVKSAASPPSARSPASPSSVPGPVSQPSVQNWVQSVFIATMEGSMIYSKDGRQFETGGARVIDNSRKGRGAKQADLFFQNGSLVEVILR